MIKVLRKLGKYEKCLQLFDKFIESNTAKNL